MIKYLKESNTTDLSNLAKRGKLYDWKSSLGKSVPFFYRGTSGILYIKELDPVKSQNVIVTYNNIDYSLKKSQVTKCELGKLFNFSTVNNYRFSVGEEIYDNNRNYLVLERLRMTERRYKGYRMRCLTCGNDFEIREGNYNKGDRCPYCSGHKILAGFNDLWTVRPDIAIDLTNPEDGYKYLPQSNKKVDFTCHICHSHLGYKTISDVYRNGLRCNSCGDKVSYPNKFLYNFLFDLGVDFSTEVVFDWCKFPSFNDANVIVSGRYDALIKNNNTIIEMDSGLGHGNKVYTNSGKTPEEDIYKDQCKTTLAKENGYNIIRINCCYYDMTNQFKACRDGIINSTLNDMYDLSLIDWNSIDARCQKSILLDICNLYELGKSSGEIANILDKDLSSVIDYLHKGTEIGMCTYIPYKQRKRKIKKEENTYV